MVDSIDRQMQEFFKKSSSFRAESRGGAYLIWTDDLEDFYIIRNSLIQYGQECEYAHTVEDILKQLDNKKIKTLILNCPSYDSNEECEYKEECKNSIEIIRKRDPLLPMIFYTPNPTCLNTIMEKNPRLTPVLKGDLDTLLYVLGLKS